MSELTPAELEARAVAAAEQVAREDAFLAHRAEVLDREAEAATAPEPEAEAEL